MLHYKEFGSGQTLLIIHGLFGSSDNWQSLIKKWSEKYHILSIDVRNHGKSPHFDTMEFHEMVQDILDVLNFLNIHKLSILGHSMGGKIAMAFADKHPSMVENLIIADIAPVCYSPHHTQIFKAFEEIDLSSYNERAELLNPFLSKLNNDLSTVNFILKNITRDQSTGNFKYKFNLDIISKYYKTIISFIPKNIFDGKVFFLSGQNSDYISIQYSESIFHFYPNAEIETVPNSGHWLHVDNPKFLIDIIETILYNK